MGMCCLLKWLWSCRFRHCCSWFGLFFFLILWDVSGGDGGGSFWDSGIWVLLIGLGLKWCERNLW